MFARIFSILLLFVSLGIGVNLTYADNDTALQGERLSKTCAGCHGTSGASPGKIIPVIGGQVEKYLKVSLTDFSTDQRPGDVMRNLSKGYTVDEQKQIAAFFVAQPWVRTPHAAETNADVSLVKACKGCHGAKGGGRGSFPRVAGQHPDYLYQSLLEYKQGSRSSGMMKLVQKIDTASLKQMADYYSSLK
jgi:cytochrome subunit of sulfide dehydrogenase